MASISNLKSWISSLRYANWDRDVLIEEETETNLRIQVFTDVHSFQISASEPSDIRPNGYLGCIASCRKPRAGEDWTRGSDLSDGPLSLETWHHILGDIISYEMVKVHRHDPNAALVDLPASVVSESGSEIAAPNSASMPSLTAEPS